MLNLLRKIFPQKIINYYHLLRAITANIWLGFPAKKLTVIGVTGTNGKTTTVQMITKILEEAGHKVAMASTINFKLGDKTWVNATKFTTLSSWKIQKFLKQAAEAGIKFAVLEVSSHSLDQNRLWGINFDTAVITNVTREHLDYHKNMERYRLAKLRLFSHTRVAAVNLDMEVPQDYLDCGAKLRYGYTARNQEPEMKNWLLDSKVKVIKAENIEQHIYGTSFQIENVSFSLKLPGIFNVENGLAAICAGLAHGIKLEIMAAALGKIKNIPGRLEMIENERGLNILVDYAVTPDSLEKLYQLIISARDNQGARANIIAVFGACGERDRGKRPIMGEVVDKFTDYIVLTNEDPYGENPEKIIEEVASGIKKKELNENYWKILDRRSAIKKALQLAKPGDYVVVTGKGAEVTMAVGKKRIPWSDRKVILEEIESVPD